MSVDRDMRMYGKLPWGWWLRASSSGLEDEQGRTWRSVRDAFWQGELKFTGVHFGKEQHELMLRTLAALDNRFVGDSENRHDLFGGDMLFWRFFMCWLGSIGMTETSSSAGPWASPLEGRLTPEGVSVLLMLRATRDPAWEALPMAEIIEAVAFADNTADAARQGALRAFEDAIGLRRHVFARENIGRSHLITLTGMEGGPGVRMPVRRVTWSMAFPDAATRDDMFAWLATRVIRWDDWGGMAFSKGQDALTQHLLGLVVASGMRGSAS